MNSLIRRHTTNEPFRSFSSSTIEALRGDYCHLHTRQARATRGMIQCCEDCEGSSTRTHLTGGLSLNTRGAFILDNCVKARGDQHYEEKHSAEVHVSKEKSFHRTPQEFRRYGHAVVDW